MEEIGHRVIEPNVHDELYPHRLCSFCCTRVKKKNKNMININ